MKKYSILIIKILLLFVFFLQTIGVSFAVLSFSQFHGDTEDCGKVETNYDEYLECLSHCLDVSGGEEKIFPNSRYGENQKEKKYEPVDIVKYLSYEKYLTVADALDYTVQKSKNKIFSRTYYYNLLSIVKSTT